MKILHLLFAALFLVFIKAPGFSQALVTRWKCGQRGGSCYFWRCPSNSRYIDKCFFGHCCGRQCRI